MHHCQYVHLHHEMLYQEYHFSLTNWAFQGANKKLHYKICNISNVFPQFVVDMTLGWSCIGIMKTAMTQGIRLTTLVAMVDPGADLSKHGQEFMTMTSPSI